MTEITQANSEQARKDANIAEANLINRILSGEDVRYTGSAARLKAIRDTHRLPGGKHYDILTKEIERLEAEEKKQAEKTLDITEADLPDIKQGNELSPAETDQTVNPEDTMELKYSIEELDNILPHMVRVQHDTDSETTIDYRDMSGKNFQRRNPTSNEDITDNDILDMNRDFPEDITSRAAKIIYLLRLHEQDENIQKPDLKQGEFQILDRIAHDLSYSIIQLGWVDEEQPNAVKIVFDNKEAAEKFAKLLDLDPQINQAILSKILNLGIKQDETTAKPTPTAPENSRTPEKLSTDVAAAISFVRTLARAPLNQESRDNIEKVIRDGGTWKDLLERMGTARPDGTPLADEEYKEGFINIAKQNGSVLTEEKLRDIYDKNSWEIILQPVLEPKKNGEGWELQEIFSSIQGGPDPTQNAEYFIDNPPEEPLEINDEIVKKYTEESVKRPFLIVQEIAEVDPKPEFPIISRFYAHPQAMPFAYTFKDNHFADTQYLRFRNAETATDGDSGILAVAASLTDTVEKQTLLYKDIVRAVIDIHSHEKEKDILGNWLTAQEQKSPALPDDPNATSLNAFIQFDHILIPTEDGTIVRKPKDENQQLLGYKNGEYDKDTSIELWQKRTLKLKEIIDNDPIKLQPYHLRQIEFLSHSVDIVKIIRDLKGEDNTQDNDKGLTSAEARQTPTQQEVGTKLRSDVAEELPPRELIPALTEIPFVPNTNMESAVPIDQLPIDSYYAGAIEINKNFLSKEKGKIRIKRMGMQVGGNFFIEVEDKTKGRKGSTYYQIGNGRSVFKKKFEEERNVEFSFEEIFVLDRNSNQPYINFRNVKTGKTGRSSVDNFLRTYLNGTRWSPNPFPEQIQTTEEDTVDLNFPVPENKNTPLTLDDVPQYITKVSTTRFNPDGSIDPKDKDHIGRVNGNKESQGKLPGLLYLAARVNKDKSVSISGVGKIAILANNASSLYSFLVNFKTEDAANTWLEAVYDLESKGTAEDAFRLLEEKDKDKYQDSTSPISSFTIKPKGISLKEGSKDEETYSFVHSFDIRNFSNAPTDVEKLPEVEGYHF